MTDNMIELAKRGIACKGWRWMPGMLAVTSNGVVGFRVADSVVVPPTCLVGLPDFTDPATLGCLLALYEETRKMLTCPDPVYTMVAAWGLMHPRTLEALVAALEAAP